MRFAPSLLDEIRARLPVSQVVSRKVALKRAGREFKGLSPFKQERTPSFTVNDHKGFYHCFASGEHGDIFTFVMKTEGLSFAEAVEQLAAEAGVPLPRPSEQQARRDDERSRLMALLDASRRFYEAQLGAALGVEARRYLAEKRALKRETIAAFAMGYAPGTRHALKEHLAGLGFTQQEMATAGMLISGEDIPVSYDRFRNRVMFPIMDLKGRTIAFGGRALDADAPAKYLNSPETPLFHKGSVLFNAARARPLAFERGEIIVVEGYMDVVALSEAGFGHSVAPLGTALTENQLALLWRMVPEPILCFDGDNAGRKAAFRAIDTALPHLRPGLSIAFAFLPDGLDPDDLIRQEGPEAMRAVLQRARPLADVLFEREWGQGQWSTPERRARLESEIGACVNRIADVAVRAHYQQAMRERLSRAWGRTARVADVRARAPVAGPGRPGHGPTAGIWTTPRPAGPPGSRKPTSSRFADAEPATTDSLRRSPLVGGDGAAPPYREALILHTVLNHPWLLDDHAEAFAEILFTSQALRRLREGILTVFATDNLLDRTQVRSQLRTLGLGRVVELVDRAITHRSDRFAAPDAARTDVECGWNHALVLHERNVGLRNALATAERLWHETGSEDALSRIRELQQQLACADELVSSTRDSLL